MSTKTEKEVVEKVKEYYTLYSELEIFSKTALHPVEKEVLEKLKRGRKVLDVGCAWGRVAIPLSKSGLEVIGIDFVPHFIREARENAQVHKTDCSFLIADAVNLPFKNKAFDYVICMGLSLPTLGSPLRINKTIVGMARVLRVNGELFVNTHNRLYPGKYGLAWIGLIVCFLVRVPRRIWRMLKRQDCAGLYFGDVFYKGQRQRTSFYHALSKGELSKAMEMAGLSYEILTDEEFLHGKGFKAKFSRTLVILGHK